MQEFIEVVFSRATKQDIIRFVMEVQRASERHKREEIVCDGVGKETNDWGRHLKKRRHLGTSFRDTQNMNR